MNNSENNVNNDMIMILQHLWMRKRNENWNKDKYDMMYIVYIGHDKGMIYWYVRNKGFVKNE